MSDNLLMKFRYSCLGNHVHMQVFVGPVKGTLANAGNITLTVTEFVMFQTKMEAKFTEKEFQFVEE